MQSETVHLLERDKVSNKTREGSTIGHHLLMVQNWDYFLWQIAFSKMIKTMFYTPCLFLNLTTPTRVGVYNPSLETSWAFVTAQLREKHSGRVPWHGKQTHIIENDVVFIWPPLVVFTWLSLVAFAPITLHLSIRSPGLLKLLMWERRLRKATWS